ncbi:MAG: formate dehydrogenase accessory sulfurtransferase FdhD [Rhodoplanes sp.]
MLTSRVSVELVHMTAVLGASLMVAISAPTALAIRTAEQAGITLVAMARDDGSKYSPCALAHRSPRRGKSPSRPNDSPQCAQGMLVDVYLRPRSRALQPFSRKVTRLTQAVGRSEPHRPTNYIREPGLKRGRAILHSGKVTWVAWMYLRFRPARSCTLRARMGAPPTAAGGVAMSSRKKERKRGRPT